MNGDTTRRDFLTRSAAAAAGLTLGLSGPARAGAAPEMRRAALPTSVNVFSKHLQFLDYDEMAEAAAEIGFDGVDLTVRPGGHVLPENVEDDLPRAVEAVRRAGLSAPMMATGVNDPRDPLTEPVLRTASALGIQAYRMAYYGYDDDLGVAGSLDAYRPLVRDLAAMNASFGLHGGYQNHAGTNVGAPVWDLAVLLEGRDPRWAGVQYDIRHATVEGANAWPLGLELLHPYVATMVIKDFDWAKDDRGRWYVRNVPAGEGMVDFPAYFARIKALGVTGPITVHYEYEMPGEHGELSPAERRRETVRVMRRDLDRLRGFMREAGL